jgi:hypothetical protein
MNTDPLTQLLISAQNSINASVLVGGRLIGDNQDAIISCIRRGVKVRFLFPSLDSEWLGTYLANASVSKSDYNERIATNAERARKFGSEVRFHLSPVISWFVVIDGHAAASKPVTFFKDSSPSIIYSPTEVQEFSDLFDLLWRRSSYDIRFSADSFHTGELKLPENTDQIVLDEEMRLIDMGYRKTPSLQELRVFLCHSSKDKPKVREIYRRLVDDGFKPWLDEEEILAGQDWNLKIITALKSSDVVILFLSKDSVSKTGYLQKELKTAIDISMEQPEGNIFLIPARLEECDVPFRLSNLHYVNLFDPNGYLNLTRSLQARQREIAKYIK